jgi:predicted phage tail protein
MTAIQIGLNVLIGELIQMLSPSMTMEGDGSKAQKNYIFNGIVNIKEQGGSVPLIFGECLFGGVVLGMNIKTTDIAVGSDLTVDRGIPEIPLSSLSTVNKSIWYRIV